MREIKVENSMELAWGIIANAYGGDWENATPEWKEAAERWRDEHWHPFIATWEEKEYA